MKLLRLLALVGVLAAGSLACAADLTVFAAASLSDALTTVAPAFTATTGDTVRFNFGASGSLVRQIHEGAPADAIVSADERRLDQLEKAGLLVASSRRTVLANQLVVVVPADAPATVASLADLQKPAVHRVAIGDPATVPAGTYAKTHLEKVALWEALHAKIVPLDNVRAVLAAVASGNVEAGFVYRTDALISKDVVIAVAIPLADGPHISYPAAAIKASRSPEGAARFVAFLSTAEARAIFARFGFLPPP